MTADSAVQVKTFDATYGGCWDINSSYNEKGSNIVNTQSSVYAVTASDRISGWLFGAILVVGLPSMIVIAQAIAG